MLPAQKPCLLWGLAEVCTLSSLHLWWLCTWVNLEERSLGWQGLRQLCSLSHRLPASIWPPFPSWLHLGLKGRNSELLTQTWPGAWLERAEAADASLTWCGLGRGTARRPPRQRHRGHPLGLVLCLCHWTDNFLYFVICYQSELYWFLLKCSGYP